MTDQQLQTIKERAHYGSNVLQDFDLIQTSQADVLPLVAEVERLRKEVHRHEQSLLHDTYSEFTAKREIEWLRGALEFYADEKNHTELRGTKIFGDVFYDKGKVARKALEGGK